MTVGPRVSETILARIRRRLGLAHEPAEAKLLKRNLREAKRKLAARKKFQAQARRAIPPKKKAA